MPARAAKQVRGFIERQPHNRRVRADDALDKGPSPTLYAIAGGTVFFEQLRDNESHEQVKWGYFDNSATTIRKVTNQNGEASVTFYHPLRFYSGGMFIHALLQVDGQAYRGSSSHVGNVPQDYIAITMYNSSPNGVESNQ